MDKTKQALTWNRHRLRAKTPRPYLIIQYRLKITVVFFPFRNQLEA